MPYLPLSKVPIYGVPGSEVRGRRAREPGLYSRYAVYIESSKGAVEVRISILLLLLGGGVGKEEHGVFLGSKLGGGRRHTLQLRNETFYGLTCSKFKGCVRENCRCWFCGIWSLDEKEKQTNCWAAHLKKRLV